MSERNELFDQYLSRHYAHVKRYERGRIPKKQYLAHNYGRFLPTDHAAPILEIGPGHGELLEWLARDSGYTQVQAVDLSQEVTDFCNNILPQSTVTVTDTTAFLRARPGTYACVFLMHVLEHIPKPNVIDFLRAIYAALQPGGCLIVELPNMANPFTGLYIRYADFTHEVGFTNTSLSFVLSSAGFSSQVMVSPQRPITNLVSFARIVTLTTLQLGVAAIYQGYGMKKPQVTTPNLGICAVK